MTRRKRSTVKPALDRAALSRLQSAAVQAARTRSAAGRKKTGERRVGAVVKVDDALRDPDPVVTEDQRLLDRPDERDFRRADSWRVLRIFTEFVEGIDALGDVRRAVSIFGSARTQPDDPIYAAARTTAKLLAHAGYTIITGGGP